MKWLKWVGYGLLALVAASIPAYWWLLAESHRAPPSRYAIDLDQVRQLADSQAGEKPQLIRLETVAHLSAPKVFVVAGDGWQDVDLPVASYELVYRDHLAVVDTALNAGIAKSMSASSFDGSAYSRLSDALARADLIVVTHEHPDHIGGLLAQLNVKNCWPSPALPGNRLLRSKRTSHQILSPRCLCRPAFSMAIGRSTMPETRRSRPASC